MATYIENQIIQTPYTGSFIAADLTARDTLPKTDGMLVYVLSNTTTYRLDPDLTTWVAQTGSGSSSSVEADDSNLIIAGQVFS